MPPRSAMPPSSASSGAERGYPASRRRSTIFTPGSSAPIRSPQLEPLERSPALRSRGRAAVDDRRALESRALGGDGACVVARVGLLLVRGIVLLVDADQADVPHRREDRRAGADHDAGLAARDPLSLVPPLGVGQAGVEQRDRVAEPGPETPDGLRRERDLRNEDDRPEPALQCPRRGLQVDLGLAAAGRPVEQKAPALADPGDGGLLVGAQRVRSCLPFQRLPLARRGLLLAPLPPDGRDQLQRPRRRRAVVVGDPEREIDQRRGQLVQHALDRQRPHADRRRVHHLDDHAPRPRAPEGNRDDGPFPGTVRQLVGELAPTEGARRHQRHHGPEAHAVEARRRRRRG